MIKAALLSILALSSTALAAPTDALLQRDDLSCETSGSYAPVQDVIDCANKLRAGSGCGTVYSTVFCESGSAKITGTDIDNDDNIELTSCDVIADGIIRVVDSCTTSDGWVGGRVHASDVYQILIEISAN